MLRESGLAPVPTLPGFDVQTRPSLLKPGQLEQLPKLRGAANGFGFKPQSLGSCLAGRCLLGSAATKESSGRHQMAPLHLAAQVKESHKRCRLS